MQYTDETFRTRVAANSTLGILGPVLRGVVGEYLAITFLNRASQPLSMHPHGVHYDKDSEGAFYQPGPGRGTPVDVDREFATLFMIFNESLAEEGADEDEDPVPAGSPAAGMNWASTQQLIEEGSRFAINGFVFGNLPALQANAGERVRWYLLALGSEQDFHTAHWHGLRVVEEGRRRTDVVELLPATMKVADLAADNPGSWLFHCHVAEHMRQGMFARFVIHPRDVVGVDRSPAAAFLGLPSPLRAAAR